MKTILFRPCTFAVLTGFAVSLFSGCASYPSRPAQRDYHTVYEKPQHESGDNPEEKTDEDKAEPFIIRSPFGNHRRMDLTGMEPGTKVQDPMTGGIFRVPAAKDDEPEIVSEPPADWKPEN